MKKRLDFVTNSSSSCYICEVCNRSEGGFELFMEDAEMFNCQNGHTVCYSHILLNDGWDRIKITEKYFDLADEQERNDAASYTFHGTTWDQLTESQLQEVYSDSWNDLNLEYDVPKELCPICQLQYISTREITEYLLAKEGKSSFGIQEEVKNNFLSYDDFRLFINKRRA